MMECVRDKGFVFVGEVFWYFALDIGFGCNCCVLLIECFHVEEEVLFSLWGNDSWNWVGLNIYKKKRWLGLSGYVFFKTFSFSLNFLFLRFSWGKRTFYIYFLFLWVGNLLNYWIHVLNIFCCVLNFNTYKLQCFENVHWGKHATSKCM